MGLTCDETWQADGVANLQMRDRFLVLNSILSETITAAAAPLYQNIPCGNLTGYTVDIRVSASVCRIVSSGTPGQKQCSKQCPACDESRAHHMEAFRLG